MRNPTVKPLKMPPLAGLWMALALCLAAAPMPAGAGPAEELQIYFIDVEGGQSTLIVTPHHRSLLIDAGFPGSGTFESTPGDPIAARDANRVLATARQAGLKRIDFLLVTHFHGDHMGGVAELAKLLPIRTFIDHGSPDADAEETSPGTLALFRGYEAARAAGQHLQPRPGDQLPLKELDALVVSAAGSVLRRPLPGAGISNPLCASAAVPPGEPHENPRSTGVLVSFGRFRFLDIGDLTGEPLSRLACPSNRIGRVDVYLVAHHGGADAADPAIFAAFNPRVAVVNNGLKKGGARNTLEALHHVAGLEDAWQLHRSDAAQEQNFPAARIANLDESTAHWILLTAHRDGSFSIVNGRTGEAKRYAAAASVTP